MENLFDVILDDDEKVIKVVKPNRQKLMLSSLLYGLFSIFFIVPIIVAPFVGIISQNGGQVWKYILLGIAGLIIVEIFVYIFARIYYKNRFYAYTNKRVIIRTGIFGIDYKSLDMGMIGAVNVYVSLIDKILQKNTGTISFGSMASPINIGSGGTTNTYKFSHLEKPYEFYKEIKSVIDNYKSKNEKK